MRNVRIAFQILNGDEAVPPTYQDIRCDMIFHVRIEDFRRKTRFVSGGHTTDTPHAMAYSSVLSLESVVIALTLADMNYLDFKMADIEYAYLTAPSRSGLCLDQHLEMMLEIVHSLCGLYMV
jgi:hypothetical protein